MSETKATEITETTSKEQTTDEVVSSPMLCKHTKSVVPGVVRRTVGEITAGSSVCRSCVTTSGKAAPGGGTWMCLTCGHVGCGRESTGGRGHAAAHFAQNPQHSISVELSTRAVWCYACDEELIVDDTNSEFLRVVDCVDIIKNAASKLSPSSSGQMRKTVSTAAVRSGPIMSRKNARKAAKAAKREKASTQQQQQQQNDDSAPPSSSASDCNSVVAPDRAIRGLKNLGNTCFFNATMQCISHTMPFVRALIGVPSKLEDGKTTAWTGARVLSRGPITSGALNITAAMHKMVGPTYNPADLFAAVSRKVPRFKSFQQQDAHELFICVLDGIAHEQKAVKTPPPGKRSSEEPSAQDEKQKPDSEAAKEDERSGDHAPAPTNEGTEENKPTGSNAEEAEETSKETVRSTVPRQRQTKFNQTFIDEIFGGETVSAVTCHVCGEQSFTREPFYNLSVPIPDKFCETLSTHHYDPEPRRPRHQPKKLRKKGRQPQTDEVEDTATTSETEHTGVATTEASTATATAPKKEIVVNDLRGNRTTSQGGCSLQGCLDAYTSMELLAGDNKYRCPKCSAAAGATAFTEATKQIAVHSLPQVLVFQIKRFSQSGRGRFEKNSVGVATPLVLNMAPFCEVGSPAAEDAAESVYVLYGTAEHSGSLVNGHYTATVACGDRWYHCSDSYVSQTAVQTALNSNAYLVFYEKRPRPTPQPQPHTEQELPKLTQANAAEVTPAEVTEEPRHETQQQEQCNTEAANTEAQASQ